jgi:hypothetical protein
MKNPRFSPFLSPFAGGRRGKYDTIEIGAENTIRTLQRQLQTDKRGCWRMNFRWKISE